jgi:hypothetical protein
MLLLRKPRPLHDKSFLKTFKTRYAQTLKVFKKDYHERALI